MTDLQRLTITRKTGKEPFHFNGHDLKFDLLSFWQWSGSDLVSNATRGRIAEYIVARSLGLAGKGVPALAPGSDHDIFLGEHELGRFQALK